MNTQILTSTRSGSSRLPLKKLLGTLILIAGFALLIYQLIVLLQARDLVRYAFYAGMLAAASTAAGACLAVFANRISERFIDSLMGFGAGVMLAASIFSLILPSMEMMEGQSSTSLLASGQVALAVLVGAAMMLLIEKIVPHEHFIKGADGISNTRLRQSWLFVLAIALHNFPEGLAIGAAYAANDGHGLAAGIAIQDMPEGFVVAMALIAVGYTRLFSITIGVLTGLAEPVMAVMGATLLEFSTHLLPWGLAGAAGAMLFVISHEIIPESHRKGHEFFATNGLILGFVLMMLLDTSL
ncbi:ZIP family metal transporter [Nitrincola iocasae]|uniref:ZIP family metal transporter n=1 Tax=Nitrincola iocasae TaxID=2614693 RepID=A0A5J6LFM9_9GAMM|nr:ZIP family metal transporter [Nitrincola iocasae]QEW07367.1 ZIP family metal transporter [Nitrincola iocasae]